MGLISETIAGTKLLSILGAGASAGASPSLDSGKVLHPMMTFVHARGPSPWRARRRHGAFANLPHGCRSRCLPARPRLHVESTRDDRAHRVRECERAAPGGG